MVRRASGPNLVLQVATVQWLTAITGKNKREAARTSEQARFGQDRSSGKSLEPQLTCRAGQQLVGRGNAADGPIGPSAAHNRPATRGTRLAVMPNEQMLQHGVKAFAFFAIQLRVFVE
jgi:hypothetical protein